MGPYSVEKVNVHIQNYKPQEIFLIQSLQFTLNKSLSATDVK